MTGEPHPDNSLPRADLDWDSAAAVRSNQFDDVYFSDLGGLEETRHVFLNGNDLPQRFAALSDSHPSTVFTIGELGFGTGLNILAAWQAWQARGHDKGRLHFFSVEGFPLTKEDFSRAQQDIADRWPGLADNAETLAMLYPPLTPGFHTLRLAGDVTLTLALGEVGGMLAGASLSADAWFLDGFSPARNEAMWRDDVIEQVARLSAPRATAATFTVAGAVRRRLQDNGFAIEKRPGFGRKRDMLTALLETPPEAKSGNAPWFSYRHLSRPAADQPVVIAGAGIAGASLAWHMRRAGREVNVYDPAGPAAGASGNPAGLIMPRLDLGLTPARNFYAHAFLYAVRLIEQLEKETGTEIFTSRGGLMLALSEEDSERHQRLASAGILPEDWLQPVSSEEAQTIAGCDLTLPGQATHLYIPKAGTARPQDYVTALLDSLEIIRETAPDNGLVIDASGPAACGTYTDMNPSLGQIDVLDHTPPACALTFGNYIAPLDGMTVTGATYDALDQLPPDPPETNENHSNRNIEAAASILPSLSGALPAGARAAIRSVTADRHPVCGALPDHRHFQKAYDGLRTGRPGPYPAARWAEHRFTLTGLGSRGLVTAPLCAGLITSLVTGAPSPLPQDVSGMINPARSLIRAIRRGKSLF